MTVYCVVKSLLVVDQQLIMTLACGHQYRFNNLGYFRNHVWLANKAGARVYRCIQCEDDRAKEMARR